MNPHHQHSSRHADDAQALFQSLGTRHPATASIKSFVIEHFEGSSPAYDMERVQHLVDRIIDSFSPEGLRNFICDTLPRLLGSIVKPQMNSDQLLVVLEQFSLNGALEHVVPHLLRDIPQASVALVIGRLTAISLHVKAAAPLVFSESIPMIIARCGHPFDSEQLYTFHGICKSMQVHTPEAIREICSLFPEEQYPQLSIKGIGRLIDICSQNLNCTSAVGCVRFCSGLVRAMKGVPTDIADMAFLEGARLWRSWGERDQYTLGETLVAQLASVPGIVPLSHLSLIARHIMTPRQARAILAGSSEVLKVADTDMLEQHLLMVQPFLSVFPESRGGAIVGYMADGLLSGREGIYARLLGNLAFKGVNMYRTGLSLDFLRQALTRFSADEFRQLDEDMRTEWESWRNMLYAGAHIEDTPLNYILGGMLVGGRESFNPWPITESEFYDRWKSRVGTQQAPLFDFDDVSIEIPMAPRGVTVRLKQGATLDRGFLSHRYHQFLAPSQGEQIQLVGEICDMVSPESRHLKAPLVSDIFELLTHASETCSRQQYVQIVEKSFPLLAPAAGYELFALPSSGATEDESFDYLESLRLLIDDGIVTILSQHGMARPFIDQIKRVASISKIERELSKFEKRQPLESFRVDFEASRNVLDEFYDQLAETCVREKYESALGSPYFQPVRGTIAGERDIIGCWYLLKAPVHGVESLMMAGGGLRRSVLKAVDSDLFHRRMISAFKGAASKLGLGGLYTAVGKAADGMPWTSEGRIAQTREAIDSIIQPDAEIIELSSQEQIDFPPNYVYGPVARLIRL